MNRRGSPLNVSVHKDWKNLLNKEQDFWNFFGSIFDRTTVDAAKRSQDKLIPLWLTQGNDIVAAALYEVKHDEQKTFLVLVGTAKRKRKKKMLHQIIEIIKDDEEHPIHLETERYSFAHAVFSNMNFQQSQSPDLCDVPIHVEENCVCLHLNPSQIGSSETPENRIAPDNTFGHFFSKCSALNLYHRGHIDQSSDLNRLSVVGNKVANLEEIQRKMPSIIPGNTDWFCNILGDQFMDWLVFQLAVLQTKEGKQCADRLEWVSWMKQRREDIFMPVNLRLLNTISSKTGVQFIPLQYDGNIQRFRTPEFELKEGIDHIVPTIMLDTHDKPLFLVTYETILPARKKLLFGPLKPIGENNYLAAKLLLPKRIGQKQLQGKESCQSAGFCRETKLASPEFEKEMEQERQGFEKDSGLGIANTASMGINTSLMVLSSGIAIKEDGSECCYTPTPEFNRRLDPKRLRRMKETGMMEMFTTEAGSETHSQPYSLFPYSFGDTGVPLKDLSTTDEGKFAGHVNTPGLLKSSVKGLWGSYFQQSQKEIEQVVKENSIVTNNDWLLVLSILMRKICTAFGRFEKKDDFKNFLCHLLDIFKDGEKREGPAECPIHLEDLHIHSLGETVLFSKILWVSLGFPVVAAIEGSARLYCANMTLLGDVAGIDSKLESFVDSNDRMPTGLRAAQASVHLYGIQGVLQKETLFELYKKSISLQDNVEKAAPIELCSLIPELCEHVALQKHLQLQICQHHNGGKISTIIQHNQNVPLRKVLENMQTNSPTIAKLLANQNCELLRHCGRHSQRSKNSSRVRYFSILLAIMDIDFGDENIKCTSPHLALKKLFVSNGEYLNARGKCKTFPWIPPGIPHPNDNDGFHVLQTFKKEVVTPLVTRLQAVFIDCCRPKGSKDIARYKVSEFFLTEWLYAYLWELMHWGGINIKFPLWEFPGLEIVKELLKPVTVPAPAPEENTTDNNDNKEKHEDREEKLGKDNSKGKNKENENTNTDKDGEDKLGKDNSKGNGKKGGLATIARHLKNTYNADLTFNLRGVVAIVVQHIANREKAIREAGDIGEAQLSFVELFATPVKSEDEFNACMQKVCPLFGISDNGKDCKISLFELTKWLFSSHSEEAKKSFEAVNDALVKHIDNGHMQLETLMSFTRGSDDKCISKLFNIMLLPGSERSHLVAGKALLAIGEETSDPNTNGEDTNENEKKSPMDVDDEDERNDGRKYMEMEEEEEKANTENCVAAVKSPKRIPPPSKSANPKSKRRRRPRLGQRSVSQQQSNRREMEAEGKPNESFKNYIQQIAVALNKNDLRQAILVTQQARDLFEEPSCSKRHKPNHYLTLSPADENNSPETTFNVTLGTEQPILYDYFWKENLPQDSNQFCTGVKELLKNAGCVSQQDRAGMGGLPVCSFKKVQFQETSPDQRECNDKNKFKGEVWAHIAGNLVTYGVVLNDRLRFLPTYHKTDVHTKQSLSFLFPEDNRDFTCIVLVVLRGTFRTLVAVPNAATKHHAEHQERKNYENWKGDLGTGDKNMVTKFEEQFKDVANRTNKNTRIVPFENKPGSILKFPGGWIHATIFFGAEPQELLILAYN